MSEGKVSWGKIVKGAAIAAGAVIAFTLAEPALQETIIPAIESFAAAIGGAVATAWNYVGENVIGNADKGLVGSIMHNPGTAAGAAAVAGGLLASRGGHAETPVAEPSFAMKEDMHRMQALMVARMQASGYQPAMALTSQARSRG